jgi:hypothetical protein
MTTLVSTLLQLAVLAANIDPPADAEWPLNLGAGLDASAALTDCDPVLLTAVQLTVPARLELPAPAFSQEPVLRVYGPHALQGMVWLGVELTPLEQSRSSEHLVETIPLPVPCAHPATPQRKPLSWPVVTQVSFGDGDWYADVVGWHSHNEQTVQFIATHQWVMPYDFSTDATPFHQTLPQNLFAPNTEPANEWLAGFGPDLNAVSRVVHTQQEANRHLDPRLAGARTRPSRIYVEITR